MPTRTNKEIFKQGSKTYYNSSIFFAPNIREDVFKFYSFVRVVDDLVDCIPPQSSKFKEVFEAYNKRGQVKDEELIKVLTNIYFIEDKYNIDKKYMKAFLRSMAMDLSSKNYKNIDDLLVYIYGSAEVIGLVMSKIIGVNKDGLHYAKLLGRSMQYINFIRDIKEDIGLGRVYIPKDKLNNYGLKVEDFKNNKLIRNKNFNKLIKNEIKQYFIWQEEAEKGFKFIPYRSRIAIKTASDMYQWTAIEIFNDPQIVLKKKVKPSRKRIIFTAIKNIFACL